jgi:hypothetical protein
MPEPPATPNPSAAAAEAKPETPAAPDAAKAADDAKPDAAKDEKKDDKK